MDRANNEIQITISVHNLARGLSRNLDIVLMKQENIVLIELTILNL